MLFRSMKLLVNSVVDLDDENALMCMANIRGNTVNVPHSLSFSFYFSVRNSSHGIRVKPLFNPNRMSITRAGNLELHGNWKFTPGQDDSNVKRKDIEEMKNFFRTYKVLFAGVWEDEIQETEVQDYFRGMISWHELVQSFDFYEEYRDILDKIYDIASLEKFVRKYDIFNMND